MKRDCNIRSRYILYASPLFCDFISSKLIVSLSRIVSVEEKRERERESERIVVREILQHLFPPGNANQFIKCVGMTTRWYLYSYARPDSILDASKVSLYQQKQTESSTS